MYVSYKDVDTQLGRMRQDFSKKQCVNFAEKNEDKSNLPENKISLTKKVKLSAVNYFYSHPIATTSNLVGIVGATIGGVSTFAFGNLMLNSTTLIVPIGIAIGATAGMLLTQKLMYKVGIKVLTTDRLGPNYLPIPNPGKVEKEMKLSEEKINSLDFKGVKNSLLEKINYFYPTFPRLLYEIPYILSIVPPKSFRIFCRSAWRLVAVAHHRRVRSS